MQAERWKRVEHLFQSALELDEMKRAEFLRQACAGDAELRREVESLLAFGKDAENFIETPALEAAAEALAMEHDEARHAEAGPRGLEGKTVSHYRVLEKLGGGGMGIVYKARDMKLGRFVALKFLPSHLADDPEAIERFRREAYAASGLNHRNICTIYDIDEYEGAPFIAMEFLSGRTLSSCIANKPLPFDSLLDLAIQICRALEAAHAQSIIHRDIKPANIFISNDGTAKILDFGVAKLVRGSTETAATSITALGAAQDSVTSQGAVLGTLLYMSPEQIRGEELDARTDLFSLGSVLYEMATGRHPFTGSTPSIIVDAILNRAPIPAGQLNPTLLPQLEEVVNKALEKDRNLRYQSAADIRTDAQRLKRHSDSHRAVAATADGAAKPVRKSIRWTVVAGAIVLVAGLAAGGWLMYSHMTHPLTDKDVVVLADFTNTTGDGVFDGTLRQGLAAQLGQSPFLSFVSEQQIQQTLHMMARGADARLTPEIAREVCQRTNSSVVLEGSIAQIGARYLLTLKAVNCLNGESLASAEAEASEKNHVLDALGKAATEIRGKLGESLSTVQKYDTPLAEATTPSLEALQAYSLGWKNLVLKSDFATAVPFFQRAIQLDPKFAMAYAALGTSHFDLGETKLAAENTRKAYELRDRVSESEKFYIESQYYLFAIGDLEKARRANEMWAQTYPRSAAPRANLAGIAAELGHYDTSLALLRQSLLLDPGNAQVYALFAFNNLQLNRLEGARAAAEEAQTKKLDSPILRTLLYLLAFLQNDRAGMAQQLTWAADKPGWEDLMLYYDADTAAYFGQIRKAREISRRAVASAERAGENEIEADYEAEAALRESLFGNPAEARQRGSAALRLFADGRDVQYGAALAAGFAGDTPRLQALANSLAENFPHNTIVQFNYLPTLRAQLALNHGDTSKAVDALEAAAPYELGMPGSGGFTPALYPVYVRGEVYLAAHQGREATAEFQRVVDQRGVVQNEPIGALAHLGLARAYALQGDPSRARDAYQDFLTLWKDADPDLPVLKQAKAEFANLQ